MRFKIIIITIVLISALLASTFYFFLKCENGQYRSEVTTVECGDDYQKASEMLMERYLSHYCSPLVGISTYLTDYRVIEIDTNSVSGQTDCYRFYVTYDVRMFTDNDWVAGNGNTWRDGWIIGKVGIGSFHKKDNKYILDSIGTGP